MRLSVIERVLGLFLALFSLVLLPPCAIALNSGGDDRAC